MKKLLSLAGGMTMAAAMFLAAAQDTPAAPEALYLVGDFTGWITPDMEGGTDFALTDEDGDGKYTGTFNIEAGPQNFKVFTAKAGWNDPTAYFGAPGECEPLYSDAEWVMPLYPGEGGNWNVSISNWEGGELTFSAEPVIRNGAVMLIPLTLTAPTQPARPAMPDAVYCIGSFNEWKIPEGDNLNGAVKIPAMDGAYGLYMDNVDVPAGNPEFKFYYQDEEGNGVYIGTDEPSFTLYKYGVGLQNVNYTESASVEGVEPFKMRDWTGTALFGTVNLVYKTVSLGALDGAQFAAPTDSDKFYAIVTVDSQEPKLFEIASPDFDNDMWTIMFSSSMPGVELDLTGAEKVQVIFTSENSLTPSAESCWGLVGDVTDSADEASFYRTVPVGKEGKALEFLYPANASRGQFSIYLQMQLGIASVSKFCEIPKTEIYLIGEPQGWQINSDAMPLKLVEGETEVYEATYDIEAGKAMFRFYEELGDWDKGSIGAQVDDFAVDITIPADALYTGNFVWGKGSWNIPDWAGGELYMRVDMKENTVSFGNPAYNAVEGIQAVGGEVRYFDLQGRRVENPSAGIFIRVEPTGKSSKVAL